MSTTSPPRTAAAWAHTQAALAEATPSWESISKQLALRVSARSERVAEALDAGLQPDALPHTPLGPRLALDVVVSVHGEPVPAAPRLRALGVPVATALAVALRAPASWLSPLQGAPGHARLLPIADLPGVFDVDIHAPCQLAGLLLPPHRLLPTPDPVALPLAADRLVVADGSRLDALRGLLSLAETVHEHPNVTCVQPHAVDRTAGPGAFRWSPWRPPPEHPLFGWSRRNALLQDWLDDQRTLSSWRAAAPAHPPRPLRLVPRAASPGGRVSVADWPRAACTLPAADCFDVSGPGGAVRRVWVDDLLDVLSAETRPLPGAWPPRFIARSGCTQASWNRIQAAATV